MSRVITLRITDEEHERIRAAACKDGLSMNQFVREAVMLAVDCSEEFAETEKVRGT